MIIKQSQKNATHMVLSLCNYFPLRIHYNERVSVFMHTIQRPATEKNSCEGVTDQWTYYYAWCDQHNSVTRAVNYIPMVSLTLYLKYYSWEVVKIFAVYIR